MAQVVTRERQCGARLVPLRFYKLPIVRSYARVGEDGNIYRTEVRRDPSSGRLVQATFKAVKEGLNDSWHKDMTARRTPITTTDHP